MPIHKDIRAESGFQKHFDFECPNFILFSVSLVCLRFISNFEATESGYCRLVCKDTTIQAALKLSETPNNTRNNPSVFYFEITN